MSDTGPGAGDGTRLADEEPLTPDEALALVQDQRYRVNRSLGRRGLPARLAPLLWPGSAAGVAGVMCLAGGLFFRDKVHYTLGAWLLITTAASMFAGVPANFAVLALAGGGGFLAATWRYVVISRRARE